MNYRNRIVGTGTANPKELKANPKNWRKHPDAQQKAMQTALEKVGWIQDVIINKTTGHLIDGHLRVETAIRNKETEIPVKYVELTEEEEKIALATFDPLTMMAEQDDEMLKQLLTDCSADVDIAQYHSDYAKLMKPEYTDEDLEAIPEVPKEAKTKEGDIYQLGDHVLMCGDATDEEAVRELVSIRGGQLQVQMYLSDPPYGIAYEGGTKKRSAIANDKLVDSQFIEFLIHAFKAADNVLAPGSAFYIWHADSKSYVFRHACSEMGWTVRQCLIWVKNHFSFGRQDYQWIHEPCLYGWKDGAPHFFIDDRRQSTVINEDRPVTSEEHPTMKPIRLLTRLIQNSSRLGDTVLDTFGGSGSTLIACEETGRKCRMMELEPLYCDVIVERWEKLTGKKAERIND